MNKFCWYCNIYTDSYPDHFDKEGNCREQMRDHVEYRRDFWKEALADQPLTDDQMCQVEKDIKRAKESPPIKQTDPETGKDIN